MHKNNFSNSRGVSLYVAIVFVSALMIVSASLMYQMISGKANEQRWVKQTQLNNLLLSAEEAARWIVTTQLPIGGSTADVQPIVNRIIADQVALAGSLGIDRSVLDRCNDVDGDPGNGPATPCFEIKIMGKGAADSAGRFDFSYKQRNWSAANGTGLYSVPLKGTGDAVQVPGDDSGQSKCVRTTGIEAANDPCNWNILKYGESVQIPLFYESPNPNPTPQNPGPIVRTLNMAANNANRAFFLRLRTPCDKNAASANRDALDVVTLNQPDLRVSGSEAAKILGVPDKISGTDFPRNCNADERMKLSPEVGTPQYLTFAGDPVIVQWSMVDDEGKTVVAAEGYDSGPGRKAYRPSLEVIGGNFQDLFKLNSQLSAGRLNKSLQTNGNNVFNFINLLATTDLKDGIKKILSSVAATDLSAYIQAYANKHLYLNLKIIKKLRRSTQDERYIPHLEYQLLTSDPVAEASSKIEVTVRLWGMTAQKTAEIAPKAGTNTFVLGNL